jgi:hypothetical protein
MLFIHNIYKKHKIFKKPQGSISENFFYKIGIFIPNNGIIIAKNRDSTYNKPLFSRFGNRIVCNYLFNKGKSTHGVGRKKISICSGGPLLRTGERRSAVC